MYKKRIKRILIIKEIERLLEQAKQYHENNKKRLKVQVRNTNRELSNKEKNIKRDYMEETDTKICLKKANKN